MASEQIEVAQIGYGKAGRQLHGGVWRGLGVPVRAYDSNPTRLENLPEGTHLAASIGEAVSGASIVDITTASGHHAEAVNVAVQALDHEMPRAWVLEKPVVSSADERRQLELALHDIELDTIFVNENYLASTGLSALAEHAKAEAAHGNPVRELDVVFYKNRVPDVRGGRFTDPTLGAYGIEMPHMLALAYHLADELGTKVNIGNDIQANVYHRGINGVPESEATYVELESNDMTIRIAQGLGPFSMDANGDIVTNDDPGIYRKLEIRLADGQLMKLEFDPVAGVEPLHSRLTLVGREGRETVETMVDNTLKRLLGGVANFASGIAETAASESFMSAIRLDSGLYYAEQVAELRDTAEIADHL